MTATTVQLAGEIWKPVVGYEGKYEVSNFGRVRSLDRTIHYPEGKHKGHSRFHKGKLLNPIKERGYLIVPLAGERRNRRHYVHRLVLLAFTGPCPAGKEACHYPIQDRACNALSNLRWDTRESNQADRIVHGTSNQGERHPLSRLTDAKVRAIKKALWEGTKAVALAKTFGVDQSTIGYIRRNKTWTHV